MSNALTVMVSMPDMERMATAVAKSGLFGMKTPEQALALMLVAQAEGLHPATAAMEYDIIQGRPARKSSAMLSRFQQSGGKMRYTERTDARVAAVFSHPQGGEVEIEWTMDRAKKAGLGGKDNWTKWPRQMLSARVISEGVRATFPGATGMFYEPGEVSDMVDVTPPKPKKATPPHDPETGEVKEAIPADATFGLPAVDADGVVTEQSEESAKAEEAANKSIAALDHMKTGLDVKAWLVKNKDAISRIRAANAEAADGLISAADYRIRQLEGAAA